MRPNVLGDRFRLLLFLDFSFDTTQPAKLFHNVKTTNGVYQKMATTHKSKKRKRQEKLQQYGVDLPEIPGVPVEVIPVLVHALKVSTKCFQNEASKAFNDNWEQVESEDALLGAAKVPAWESKGGSALDNVLNRMDGAAEDTEEWKQQQQRQIKMKDAVQSWLLAVKRFATKKSYHHRDDPATTGNDGRESNNKHQSAASAKFQNRKSVPLCCFLYLLELGQEHKRLAVRRSALYMNRLLLDKSADCRRHFLEEALWPWLQMLSCPTPNAGSSIATSSGGDQPSTVFDATKQRLWQQEGHKLLLYLLRENYGDLYPKLAVAEQYLRQACSLEDVDAIPSTGDGENGDAEMITNNMATLRKLRDIAMDHGEEEMRRVNRLIQRCHRCMDVLVPRLGEADDSTTGRALEPNVPASGNLLLDVDGDDNDGEDGEIDWEDGWEAEEEESALEISNDEGLKDRGHASAVEETLQAMAAMAGGFKDGVLEIDMNGEDTTNPSDEPLSTTPPVDMLAARKRFKKCAGFLADRHLPRIRAWLEGLAKADRLYSNHTKSLILMPFEHEQQRDQLRKNVVAMRTQVLSVMESAARLGLISIKTKET